MSEAKHTPGPWEVGPVDDTVVTHTGADGIRYEVAAIDGDYNDPDTWPIMEANARLIAAAPDMAAALRECQSALAMIVAPDAGKKTSALHAFAQATAAKAKAGAALSKAGLPQ